MLIGNIALTNEHTSLISIQSLPFWIMTLGLAGRKWEKLRTSFMSDFVPSFLKLGFLNCHQIPKRSLELSLQTLVAQMVHLAATEDETGFRDIFSPISLEEPRYSPKNRKQGTSTNIWLSLAKWTLEELEKQGKNISSVLGSSFASNYVNRCIDYLKKPSDTTAFRNEVAISILPRIIPKTDGERIWNIILHLLKATTQEVDYITTIPAKIDIQADEERLAFEMLVRFYEWLLPSITPTNALEISIQHLSIASNDSYTTPSEEIFDLRRNPIFFSHMLFRGLSSNDSVIRKRITYVLKRMSQSPSNVDSKWWSCPRTLHVATSASTSSHSSMEKYLLLMDSLDDSDMNIVTSMWPLFDQLLDSCSDDLSLPSNKGDLIHDGLMKTIMRRILWTCDSKVLKRWVLWRFLKRPHSSLQRMTRDISLVVDIIRETTDMIGERISKLDANVPSEVTRSDNSKEPSSSSSEETNQDHMLVSVSSFHSFFDMCLSSLIVKDGNDGKSTTSQVEYARHLVQTILTDSSLPATAVYAVFSYLSTAENVQGIKWRLPIFNSDTTSHLLNSLQSTFMGYTPMLQYMVFHTSLNAVKLHLDPRCNSLPLTLFLLLQSIPSYFALKAPIHNIMCGLASHLTITSAALNDIVSTHPHHSTSDWLSSRLLQQIELTFNTSDQTTTVPRSIIEIRSFERVKKATADSILFLGLTPPSFALSFLKLLFDIIVKHLEKQPSASITAFGIMATTSFQIIPSSWSSFIKTYAHDITSSPILTLLANLLQTISNPNDEDGVQATNKSIEGYEMLFAASSILPLLNGIEIDAKPLIHAIEAHQSFWSDNKRNVFELFSSIGALQSITTFFGSNLNNKIISDVILNLLSYAWPHRANSGLDGPTWKWIASKFESARWNALHRMLPNIKLAKVIAHNTSLADTYIETCVEQCNNVNLENLPLMMKTLKCLLPLATKTELNISSDRLQEWITRLERMLRQEKTFLSKQVYHLMAAVLNPSLLVCERFSSVLLEFMECVVVWAESSAGIANWLIRLIETATVHALKDTSIEERQHGMSAQLETFCINIVPILFKLAIFGPSRPPNHQFPSNSDLQLAGFVNTDSIDSSSTISSADGDPSMSIVSDIRVRAATGALIALLLQKSSKFNTTFVLHIFGQPHDVLDSEKRWKDIDSQKSPFHAVFSESMPSYMAQHYKKDTFAHHLNYRRFQLLPFLAMRCDEKILLHVVWPLLHLDHLASILELLTLSTSILSARIIESDNEADQHALLQKLAETLSTILPSDAGKLNDDVLFSWISLAGFALLSIDLKSQQHLVESWKKVFLLLLPFLSFNTLYIRGTTQQIFTAIMDSKQNQLDFISSDFVVWLNDMKSFVKSIYGMRPMTKTNRRETFYVDFVKLYSNAKGSLDDSKMIFEMLKMVYCSHPIQQELTPSERVNESNMESEMNRIGREMKMEEKEEGTALASLPLNPPPALSGDEEEAILDSTLGTRGRRFDASTFPPILHDSTISSSSSSSSSVSFNHTSPPISFQRKIVPWQSMDMSDSAKKSMDNREQQVQASGEIIASPSSSKQSRQEIIIVASLLKKMPNLGGLTRTAEIFAASKLILPSLSIINDKTFQDVSVSAQHWLPMEEVPESQLLEYLATQKTAGYSLIGLEQTSNSLSLESFSFPTKSLLLLGDEKHGIPVHLLQVLDACVEIPQLGLIRSLNVHVSASICIWEYTKQHL
jgi:tRNA G18 (ribose-2'-O)-methylase SpoU